MIDDGVRVRPHVAKAVARARHVLLDFDGVCFTMPKPGPPKVILDGLEYRASYWAIPSWSLTHVVAYLANNEPEIAATAEAAATAIEARDMRNARVVDGLPELLTTIAASGRRAWVIGDYDETLMRSTLRAHGVEQDVAVVAGRRGPEPGTIGALGAASLVGADPAGCLLVTGYAGTLHHAENSGMALLGVVSGHDNRKYLAQVAPVVSNLTRLRQALAAPPPDSVSA